MGSVANEIQVQERENSVGIHSTALKLVMRNSDTTIDNIGKGTLSSLGVIDIILCALLAVGNRAQTPRSIGLCCKFALLNRLSNFSKRPDSIWLNKSNLSVVISPFRLFNYRMGVLGSYIRVCRDQVNYGFGKGSSITIEVVVATKGTFNAS